MTEAEAKTKWCPMYRVCGNEPADNRPWKNGTGSPPDVGEINTRVAGCIGSACMAWRVATGPLHDPPDVEQYRVGGGYCGLAGKP